MAATTVELGTDLTRILEGLNLPVQDAGREFIVLELYRRHVISSGRASELLQMSKEQFIRWSSDLGIPFFDLSPEESELEFTGAEEIGRASRL